MKGGMVLIWVAFMVAAMPSLSSGKQISWTVMFLPFEVETYSAVTVESIACDATETWVVSELQGRELMKGMVGKGHGMRFDDNRVRAMVSAGRDSIFVDANGVVGSERKAGMIGAVGKIDRGEWMKFRDSLRPGKLRATKGCHSSIRSE